MWVDLFLGFGWVWFDDCFGLGFGWNWYSIVFVIVAYVGGFVLRWGGFGFWVCLGFGWVLGFGMGWVIGVGFGVGFVFGVVGG